MGFYADFAEGGVALCGHRGNSLHAPENTLAAFRSTKAAGGHACEIDTILTADDAIVVLHDRTLDRTTDGKGPVHTASLAEVKRLDAGAWFGAGFAGERVPTLAEAIEEAVRLDIGLVVEVKEQRRVGRFLEVLKGMLAAPGALERVMLISFDHRDMLDAKEAIPGLRTEGITHERFVDPVAVAQASRLDSLSIERGMFREADARALRAAGVEIRCHLERPEWFARWRGYGDDYAAVVRGWAGLVDSFSGDDVVFLKEVLGE
jgi:glycerophosphoryl diester phosphodiesterase